MAFTMGTPLVSQRSAEMSAQRATVCAKAYQGGPKGGDNQNEDEQYEEDDSFQERVVQVRRVTKVVKGGKQLRFRATVSFISIE
jgi:small subunit ribosomal protein S5